MSQPTKNVPSRQVGEPQSLPQLATGNAPAPPPAPRCADCGKPRDDSGMHFEAPGKNWGAALHHFRSQPDARPTREKALDSAENAPRPTPEAPKCEFCADPAKYNPRFFAVIHQKWLHRVAGTFRHYQECADQRAEVGDAPVAQPCKLCDGSGVMPVEGGGVVTEILEQTVERLIKEHEYDLSDQDAINLATDAYLAGQQQERERVMGIVKCAAIGSGSHVSAILAIGRLIEEG